MDIKDFMTHFFPGIAAMANIHPLTVHFPIALLSSFFFLELSSMFVRRKDALRVASGWMLYLGVLGAGVAVAAGLWAEHSVPHDEAVHAIIEQHELYGFSVLALAIVLTVWRLIGVKSVWARILHVSMAALMVGAMALGGDLGGLMVYGHGVGIRSEESDHHHHDGETQHDHEHDSGHFHY